ncbi:hypothetical protein AAC387_Pa06g1672 [Persea americana]
MESKIIWSHIPVVMNKMYKVQMKEDGMEELSKMSPSKSKFKSSARLAKEQQKASTKSSATPSSSGNVMG